MRSAAKWCGVVVGVALGASLTFARVHEHQDSAAAVTVETGVAGCAVDLDGTPAGTTNTQGALVLTGVDPTDHYVHVRCPGQDERGYLISPRRGGQVKLQAALPVAGPPVSGLEAAEAKIALRKLVLKAVQERAAGEFDGAVADLHEAARMDPANSDLHRELGITFLLVKDWKRARVEMLEAIRHDPNDADAHNGLGYALEKMGDTRAALPEYRTATHLDPDDASYRKHYIEALAELSTEQSGEKSRR